MYDLVIRNARILPSDTAVDSNATTHEIIADLAIKNGKIALIGDLPTDAISVKEVNLAGDHYVSAGWIDLHTHCYSASPIYNDEPDKVGIESGVTTVIDAGSTGADDIDDFQQLASLCKTQVHALLNISKIGLLRQNELADFNDIDEELVSAAILRHPEFIVGLKARMSGSVIGANGLLPLKKAKSMQANNLASTKKMIPLMVHVGNTPPEIDEIMPLLEKGDILTHCYNGKPNQILKNGLLRPAVQEAIDRGVLMDIGHGGASFSFDVAEKAIKAGVYPHTISSDIYCKNRINGPVYSLAHVMSKFFSIGLSLSQIIRCVTLNAADALNMSNKGRLEVGADADLTIFTLDNRPCLFIDTENDQRQGNQSLTPLASSVNGHIFMTQAGEDLNDFNL